MIMLTFTEFHLEASTLCNYDYLQIHDGSSTASHMIGKYCGTTAPGDNGNLNSTHNQIYLWFHSDNSVNADGFKVTWQAADPGV